MRPVRGALAALVVVVMAIAVVGIGMGDAPTPEGPAPSGAALVASKSRIAMGGAKVAEGKREFDSEGCASCHAIAADGYEGVLGPRLDTDTDPADEVLDSITKPREDVVEGYQADLMPTTYGKTMTKDELDAVVAYIQAASGKGEEGG